MVDRDDFTIPAIDPYWQISWLIRSGEDALRLILPIVFFTDSVGAGLHEAEELKSLLKEWDRSSSPEFWTRIEQLCEEIDNLIRAKADWGELEKVRVPLDAIAAAAHRQLEQCGQRSE